MTDSLTKDQIQVLSQYAHTSDGLFMQSLSGATDLMALGLLEFRGESWGSRFFSITEKGRQILEESEK